MKSFIQKKENIKRDWYILDAKDIPLGRLASKAANLLRGKHKTTFTPNVDCGDYVIIINSNQVLLTGNKLEDKKYYNHSQYPGGLRIRTAKEMVEKYPNEMIELAIRGMLPKGRLGRAMFKKLFVYVDENHKHEAQKPKQIEVIKEK